MVDTGASIVALTFEDAERAGLYIRDRDYTQRVNTANGLARIAPVTLDRVSIGDIMVRNVPAAVSEPGQAQHHAARHVVPEPAAARRHAQRHAGPAGIAPICGALPMGRSCISQATCARLGVVVAGMLSQRDPQGVP